MAQDFGVIGLGVMGENLILNLERNGISVAVYNRTYSKTEEFLAGRARGKNIAGYRTVREFIRNITGPRRILLMVKAGSATDATLKDLVPGLSKGDIVIDGGNSLYSDTERRHAEWSPTGVHFFGMGVSGGEEGALNGPSLMPGGDQVAYEALKPVLEKIAAKTDSGSCVTYCGTKSAGHFVKMVHNGIEYGDMQLIAEAYDLMRHVLGMSLTEIKDQFAAWNSGRLSSYLIEITSRILDCPDDLGTNRPLLDIIVDSAGQKGTGKWTTTTALDLGVPVPTITAAVDARLMSALKKERVSAEAVYPRLQPVFQETRAALLDKIESALYAAKICSYAQGFAMLRTASKVYQYGIHLAEVARIWKGGCIIRAVFLDRLRETFAQEPELPNLLVAKTFQGELTEALPKWRDVVRLALDSRIAVLALSASLAYFESYTRGRLPANVIQAQRDFFGAHTYERDDREGVFHADWQGC